MSVAKVTIPVCGKTEERIRYQWANLTGKYYDPSDYKQMCPSCHKRHDFTPEQLRELSAKGNAAIRNNPEIRKKMSDSAKRRWARQKAEAEREERADQQHVMGTNSGYSAE